ncbi:MAG: hypothetical protein J3K34DRAFT_458208 [Monoraphidium minutum]|nr:MAG: hypothetical protein J3K34DRAFT_458208 [Monoraphidium minutum]
MGDNMKKSVSTTMLPKLPEEVVRLRFDDRGGEAAARHAAHPQSLKGGVGPDTHHKIMRAPEWRHIHSEWRYIHSLFVYIGRPAGIMWRVKLPLMINLLVAVGLILNEEFNSITRAATMVPEFAHDAVLQMFQLTSFVLALLLALRHNRTYERWWDAWRNFRRLGDCAVALTQQATIFCADEPALQAEASTLHAPSLLPCNRRHWDEQPCFIARWAVLWLYSVVQFCSGAPQLDPLARNLLSEAECEVFDAAPNKFSLIELKLRRLVSRMKLPTDQAISVDLHLREGWQCVRTCSTIKQTALPYALTLMCTGFLETALLLLPIGFIGRPYHALSGSGSWTSTQRASGALLLLGLYIVTNLLLLGGDEVACQLEDPFRVLPLSDRTEGVVDLIRRTFDEAEQFEGIDAAAAAARGGASVGGAPSSCGGCGGGGVTAAAGGSALWAGLERTETLKRLDDIVLQVQPMHRSDSLTRTHSGWEDDVPVSGSRRRTRDSAGGGGGRVSAGVSAGGSPDLEAGCGGGTSGDGVVRGGGGGGGSGRGSRGSDGGAGSRLWRPRWLSSQGSSPI